MSTPHPPAAPTALRVLIVEDMPSQRLVLGKQVQTLGFEVATAEDGKDALALMESHPPHILLTDWVMPRLDGVQLCQLTRASDWGTLIYIIMLTAHGDADRLVEAFDAGADDYLNKPVNPRELLARLRAGKRVVQLQAELARQAENLRLMNEQLAAANRQLFNFAHIDALTGLPNRRYIVGRLEQEWAAYSRRQDPLSLILLDIDHFKQINDAHGHHTGDLVLERIADILRHEVRAADTVARFGGEEFLIITPGSPLAGARQVAERIRTTIEREASSIDGLCLNVTASFGIAGATPETKNYESLLQRADVALYQAKGDGRNRVCG